MRKKEDKLTMNPFVASMVIFGAFHMMAAALTVHSVAAAIDIFRD